MPKECPECGSENIKEVIGKNPHDYGEASMECRDCGNEWNH